MAVYRTSGIKSASPAVLQRELRELSAKKRLRHRVFGPDIPARRCRVRGEDSEAAPAHRAGAAAFSDQMESTGGLGEMSLRGSALKPGRQLKSGRPEMRLCRRPGGLGVLKSVVGR